MLGEMADVVHIVPGLRPPELEDADRADRIFEPDDRFSCGPLLPFSTLDEWTTRRFSFWRSVFGEGYEYGELFGDPSGLARARTVVLWLDASLDSQLTLAWLPALLRAVGAFPERVDLVQASVGRPALEPFAAHPPPMTLSREDLAEVGRVWEALVAPEPDPLVDVLGSDWESLPMFKHALRSLLLRYPEKTSGLNTAEMMLLAEAREGTPKAARVIGHVLGEMVRGPDACGDSWLFRRLLRLGDPSLPAPALELHGSTEAYRFVNVRLTAFGERVLAGAANFVDRNGIDDWVAGVHLQSAAGRVWFYDAGRLVRRP
jgi:hypothetical protein